MNELNGIVIINKPQGYTSHDVVNVVRKALGTRKVGHTGTLDPNAEGVLPICVGKATKACDMLTFSDKEYIAGVKLGISTDTYDIWGEIQHSEDVCVSKEQITDAVSHFVGKIKQIPPMYSAIKKNGKKLYELAREGIEIELEPRDVTIYSADVSNVTKDSFVLRVKCSKGTYIRSLCRDIGEYIGCGATMMSLVRVASSVFTIDESITLDELKEKTEKEGPESVLNPVDSVFSHYPELKVNEIVEKRLLNGAYSRVKTPLGIYRVYNPEGQFIGIAEVIIGEKGNVIKMKKGFV